MEKSILDKKKFRKNIVKLLTTLTTKIYNRIESELKEDAVCLM